MKNLITCVACMILLMAFVVQFAHQQSLFQQAAFVNHLVIQFEKEINVDGTVTQANEERLCRGISKSLKCRREDVSIRINAQKDYLQYEVKFPISKILATPEFWGISEDDNRTVCVINRDVILQKVKNEGKE